VPVGVVIAVDVQGRGAIGKIPGHSGGSGTGKGRSENANSRAARAEPGGGSIHSHILDSAVVASPDVPGLGTQS
jgi:hypothetical protein